MTQAEFDRWWADLTLRFPSVDSWLVKVAPDQIAQRTMLRTWFGVLKDVDVQDSLEVNRLMQLGDLGWVGEYDNDKERLPQHVRRLVRQLAYDNRERPPEEPSDKLKPTSFPAGKILRRIIDLVDHGTPPDEARAIVLSEMPVGRPNYQPRYHCLICLDVGMVTVASQTALDMLLADKFQDCHHRESAIRCSCRANMPQNPKRPSLIYDPCKDFKIEDLSWKPSEVERFREWAEAKRDEYWESRRHHEFDRFNERAVAP